MNKIIRFTFILFFVLSVAGLSQWANNPNATLAVCDTTGEQALSKIAVRPDGGCYVSWFDTRLGSYSVYMQNLDAYGNKLWASGGLLISNNPQNTSLVDYDLDVDAEGNALVTFTDIREGSLKPYIYKIGPTGQYVWGSNGIGLSESSSYQANPKIAVLSDGNIAVIWIIAQAPYKIGMHLLSPSGVKLWGETQLQLQDGNGAGYNYPDVVPSDSGRFILLHTVTTGNFPAQTVKLRSQKISGTGLVLWAMPIQDLGRIAAFSVPKVIPDKLGGGIIAWHDDRDQNSIQAPFMQRIKPDGGLSYTANGIEMASFSGNNKFNPVVCFDPADENIYSFWLETDGSQNSHGISGQMVSSAGNLVWGAAGKVFKALSSPNTLSLSSFNTFFHSDRIFAFYLNGSAGGVNQSVQGFAVNNNGDFEWTGDFVTLSSSSASKLQMVGGIDPMGNTKLTWGDTRLGDAGIYGQDINRHGQLGNALIPVELISFKGWYTDGEITLFWTTATETNNSSFTVERKSENIWEAIGTVPGKGTSLTPTNYRFSDIVTQGVYTYRLKQTDFDGTVTYSGEIEVVAGSPAVYSLYQNYPNPFNPETAIRFVLAQKGELSLKIYDILGNETAELFNGTLGEGTYTVLFDATALNSGVYVYRLNYGSGLSITKKMTLLK